ncbi:homeobox-leucine zipper protein HAT3 [Ziziphus jujuba]|uniref:Homeobox-leucine zipper protein HAT3 n=1 Tax=Ziziphus jujuba TaxID=326968 RepID=A0A6P4AL32_ZIZJJ|nr:homeobox-leucine zipper protein HAT3 [Ziziphus jujuba]
MGEKDDGLGLALSLSLGCGRTQPSPNKHNPSPPMQNHKTSWSEIFQFSDRNSDTRSFLRGLDVNRTPSVVADFEEENGVSSPNSTISSASGKRSEREPIGEETEGERASCSRESDDEDGNGGDMSRKKLRLSKEQSMVLEETFKEHNTLNPKQKVALAKQLNLRARQVEVWFQNRRARTKLKQTEVDCEYLRRCCENLTEENRRLQKEVQELRALKLSPQMYMHMSPPTTLTMCPSCERVAVSSSSSSTAVAPPSSTFGPTGPNRQPAVPGVQRPVPMNPWATLQMQHRQTDASSSRS